MATFRIPQAEVDDPMAAVRAWIVRMSTRHGPRVWDQEERVWLPWEKALSRQVHGSHKVWLLDTPVWNEADAAVAYGWEFERWPIWAVKAHLVDVRPCEFDDHRWVFRVNDQGPELECVDTCDDPRVYCDNAGRYVFPACQSIPDLDAMKLEIPVRPEWVYHSAEEWWLELTPLSEGTVEVDVLHEEGWTPPPEWRTR